MIDLNEPVIAVWRPPFSNGGAVTNAFAPNATLADMVADMAHLPPDFVHRGEIVIGGHSVERAHWHRVRLLAGRQAAFHYPLAGGGGQGGGNGAGKAVLATVLAIAAVLTAGAALAGNFAFGGLFLAGTTSAKVLAAGITFAGQLAASAIAATPANPQTQADDRQDRGPASISGNVLAAGAPIPRVVGTRPLYPPLACQPLIERIGQDEYAEAIFALAGPHMLEDVRIGSSLVNDTDDVEIELREGLAGDAPLGTIERYGVTKNPNAELSAHTVKSSSQSQLENQANPTASLPTWQSVESSVGADELWMHLLLPEGLYNQASGSEVQSLPIRIRMREVGETDWINIPELVLSSKDPRQVRISILFKWGDGPETNLAVPSSEGFTSAHKYVAGQTTPSTDGWTAHSMFSAGSGSDALYSGGEYASNVRRLTLGDDTATIWLDEAEAPKVNYEIQIKRGMLLSAPSFSKSAHTYGGSAIDFFSYTVSSGTAVISRSRAGLADKCYLLRLSSVYNSHPIAGGKHGPGMALIGVKSRNKQIENLSVKASGYVADWDGSDWTGLTVTSNPAPHYRDILRGRLSPDPLPEALVDNDGLVAWRTACASNSYTCDLVCEDAGVQEVLTKVAACGFARPYQSEIWGVIRDYDRSAEDPVQIFTMRNSSELSLVRSFQRLPDALRCVYRASDSLGEDREILVWRPGQEAVSSPRIEAVRYDGLTTEAAVQSRAEFDLAQGEYRASVWSLKAPAEAIRCRRGSLVGVNHDVLDITHGAARIVDVEKTDGDITGVTLDSAVPCYDEPDMHEVANMHTVTDMHMVGLTSSLRIRGRDGLFSQHAITGGTGFRRHIQLATPVTDELDDDDTPIIADDCLVWIGRAGSEERRLIVGGMKPDKDLVYSLSLVDEAPEIWAI